MSPVFISREDRILIIAPHPDDEIIGVGGMLLSYTSQCDIIVLTDGAIGQRDLPPAQERKKRRIEFLQEIVAVLLLYISGKKGFGQSWRIGAYAGEFIFDSDSGADLRHRRV